MGSAVADWRQGQAWFGGLVRPREEAVVADWRLAAGQA
jgi:hypothetical protein